MKTIRDILGKQYRGERDKQQAVGQLMLQCTSEEMADFIVEAKNRGWITNFNIGLDEDGEPI